MKINNKQTYYEVLETIPKLTILSFYLKSIFIGLWVLLKWFVYLIWSNLMYNTKSDNNKKSSLSSSADYYDGYDHDKPPSILVDNKLGRHSYVKLKVI